MGRQIAAPLVCFLACALSARAEMRPLNDAPPRAQLITATTDDAGNSVIAGAAGAVAGGASVVCLTMGTGHYSWVPAAADGSFRCSQFAPAGTPVLIKTMPDGHVDSTLGGESNLFPYAGTLIHIADPPPAGGEVRFAGASLTFTNHGGFGHGNVLPPFRFEGSIAKLIYAANEILTVRGKVIVDSPVLEAVTVPMTVQSELAFQRISGPDGAPVMLNATLASTFMTPTAFPIEAFRVNSTDSSQATRVPLRKTSSGRAEADLSYTYSLAQLLPSYYRPYLMFFFNDVPEEPLSLRPVIKEIMGDAAGRNPAAPLIYIPIIRIGNPAPPRIPWTLLTDIVSEGVHGARAIEDRSIFGISSRVVTQPETLVVPRRDPVTGNELRYRLEPYAPTISIGDRGIPGSPPLVPFAFPSGSLRVRITRPDGREIEIGPAPFVQSRITNPVAKTGSDFDRGGGHIADVYQLSTMDPRYEIVFPMDGRYVVRLDGTIDDVWGNQWTSSGTYDVVIAEPLVLDTAVLPGTPFEEGNHFSSALTVIPPVPADVEVRLRLLPDSDQRRAIERVVVGRANRYGHFDGDSIDLPGKGEYRVDISASWRDKDGNLRFGVRSWGGVVAPRSSPVIAHGVRGIEGQTEPREAWFRRSEVSDGAHVNLPFHRGDVLWSQKDSATNTTIKFQDTDGRIAPLFLQRVRGLTSSAVTDGEIPTAIATPDGRDPHLDPSRIDLWSYHYRSIQRPLVRVRELVAVDMLNSYWRFLAQYGGQHGVSMDGDLPNDFKFQFGGVVIRGSALQQPVYSIYGSLFVLVPNDDSGGGTRVFPPFQGNSGGLSGGPLFKLKGRDIDLFFHSTALHPGSILQLGQTITIAGYVAPTLPAKVEVTLTTPSGSRRTIAGTANLIGYFHEPSQDPVASEAGVWRAKIKATFDGQTSAGRTQTPLPAGDILGTADGEFAFYVVDAFEPVLEIDSKPRFVRPSDGPISFVVSPPVGLSNPELAYSVTMPGFLLEEGTSSQLRYTYDAPRLARDFPNLDLHGDDGTTGADTVTMSFVITGTDAAGRRRTFARQIVLQGEELMMPSYAAPPRRRAVQP